MTITWSVNLTETRGRDMCSDFGRGGMPGKPGALERFAVWGSREEDGEDSKPDPYVEAEGLGLECWSSAGGDKAD